VAAIRERLRRRHAVMRGVETGLHAGGQFGRIARGLRDLEEIEAQVGAGHAERAIIEDDVVRRSWSAFKYA
jgi:hypothetical protein